MANCKVKTSIKNSHIHHTIPHNAHGWYSHGQSVLPCLRLVSEFLLYMWVFSTLGTTRTRVPRTHGVGHTDITYRENTYTILYFLNDK